MRNRWLGDGGGGGGARLGAGDALAAFLAELGAAGWLTEDPEAHLGPKLRAWLQGRAEWTLAGTRVLEDGTWEVRAGIAREARARERRAAALALIGSFAEDRLFVDEERDGGPTFVVATGQAERDGFRAHGHLVRLVIV